eukprot:6549333-Prymnesium_polylepis.2
MSLSPTVCGKLYRLQSFHMKTGQLHICRPPHRRVAASFAPSGTPTTARTRVDFLCRPLLHQTEVSGASAVSGRLAGATLPPHDVPLPSKKLTWHSSPETWPPTPQKCSIFTVYRTLAVSSTLPSPPIVPPIPARDM